MEYINTGKHPNDYTADSFIEAISKINRNFAKLKIDGLKYIVWNRLEDTEQAMKDVNYNFKLLDKK